MKILFDARHIDNMYSGLARYTAALVSGLIENAAVDIELTVMLLKTNDDNYLLEKILKTSTGLPNIQFEYVDIPLFGMKHLFLLHRLKSIKNADVYIYPHFDVPLFIKARVFYVVHDMFILEVPGYLSRFAFIKKVVFWMFHNFNALLPRHIAVCVSKSTEKDLKKNLLFVRDAEIKTVLSGHTSFSSELCSIKLPAKYLLYVGDRRPHKNLRKMISIFLELKKNDDNYYKNLCFVIVGSPQEYGEDIAGLINETEGIFELANVDESELNYIYSNCESLFFLTKYEGFGFPVLEAANFNKKIVSSCVGAVPEIAPKGSLLLHPAHDNSKLVNLIDNYLTSSEVVNTKQEVEYLNWKSTSNKFLSLIKYS